MPRKYKPTVTEEKSFTAYIVKGNRQVIEREVTASKRFRVNEDTYIIDPDCIFRKNIAGQLRSVSYYREGNPQPYDFEKINKGISTDDLDRFFAEDFFNIVVNLDLKGKAIYMLFVIIVNLALLIVYLVWGLINAFII